MSWPEAPDPAGVARHELRPPAPAAGELVRAWETAVRIYGQAQSRADLAAMPDVGVADAMAAASARLAHIWRGLLAAGPMPHWVSAAVETAAEVFEEQADAWRARQNRARQTWEREIGQ